MVRSVSHIKKNRYDESRRRFIKLGLLAAAGSAVPQSVLAYAKPDISVRSLSFYNEHTHETLSVDYYKHGAYLKKALGQINYILRDHRSGEVHPIDRRLVDLLYVLSHDLDVCEPFHIISGYRSPETNTMLRSNSQGVAKKSFHMVGKAIDISLPSVPLKKLQRTAMHLRAGGVGYYPESAFVHVDIGPVRYW